MLTEKEGIATAAAAFDLAKWKVEMGLGWDGILDRSKPKKRFVLYQTRSELCTTNYILYDTFSFFMIWQSR